MPRFPRALEKDELDMILKITEPGTPLGVSVRLGLFAGLRIGEISRITRSDIKRALQTGMFSVRKEIAKYNKPRTIPVCPYLANSLAMWLNRHDTQSVKHLRLWNESKRTVQRRFQQLTGICQFGFTPHDLRHTFSCALYTLCRDLSLVQAALGHTNLKTTLVYVHIEGLLQREIEEAYHRFQSLPARMKYNDKIEQNTPEPPPSVALVPKCVKRDPPVSSLKEPRSVHCTGNFKDCPMDSDECIEYGPGCDEDLAALDNNTFYSKRRK